MTETKPTIEQQPHDRAAATDGGAGGAPGAQEPEALDAPEAPDAAPAAGEGSPHAADGSPHGEQEAAEVAGDLDELVRVAAQRDEYLALAQRTQADFENYRKRVAREAAAAQERGSVALARELLPALDNLDRALDAAAAEDPLLEGVRLVRSELATALARAGIESYSPAGEAFDPSLHEAVATAPNGEAAPSGTVVEVYQPGYRLGETVIRPARVVVSA